MNDNRAGGCSGNVSVNPPANSFPKQNRNKKPSGRSGLKLERSFSPKTEPPEVLSSEEIGELLSRSYIDAKTMQAGQFIDTAGYEHAKRYLPKSGVRSLRRAHNLMLFDIEYQSIILKYIGFFELAFRARYSREMAELRGPFSHRDPSNFIDLGHFDGFLSNYAAELSRATSNKGPMRDAYRTFGDLPIWKAVEIMSLGTLSKLYRNTKSRAVKKNVASAFGVDTAVLASWLRTLTLTRNQCAHFGKLVGTSLTSQPKKIDGVCLSTSSHFYTVLILIRLLHEVATFDDDPTLNHDMLLIGDVSNLIHRKDETAMDAGIPFNWKTVMEQTCEGMGVDLTFNEKKRPI